MTMMKIALTAALAAGTALPANAATGFTGQGQIISVYKASPSATLESVIYDISYNIGSSFINRSFEDQVVTFSASAGASPFTFGSFSTSRTVLGSERDVGFSTIIKTSGILTGSAISAFIGTGDFNSNAQASVFSSSLGSPNRGSVTATYSIAYVYAVAAVPEPSTWALMLAGFALTGYALRWRRSTLDPISAD